MERAMDKQKVISFFDKHAENWDVEMIRNEEVIKVILDNANVEQGVYVWDVACGTGVLIPDYLKRGAAHVVGIDIAPNMVKIAAEKFAGKPVEICLGDVENYPFTEKFDCIMVYNAFPHFPNPAKLVEVLSGLLKEGGRLCIAHGMSKEWIDRHHQGAASEVSVGLMEAEELAALMTPYLDVRICISDEKMYQVVGIL